MGTCDKCGAPIVWASPSGASPRDVEILGPIPLNLGTDTQGRFLAWKRPDGAIVAEHYTARRAAYGDGAWEASSHRDTCKGAP